jgi:large subunit ribosomal protein L23
MDISKIIKKPRITEKGAVVGELSNAYVFEVYKDANKGQISRAIEEKYKVKPVKVNIVNGKAKKLSMKGKVSMKGAHKKAYVFLKKGDKIEII